MISLPRTVPVAIASVTAMAALGTTLFSARPANAAAAMPTSTCLPLDSNALVLQGYLRELVTTADARSVALRSSLGLSPMDSSIVMLVTGERIFANVADAINTEQQTPGLERHLYVFGVGKLYAAQDHEHPSGEWWPTVVVNGQYQVVGVVLAP